MIELGYGGASAVARATELTAPVATITSPSRSGQRSPCGGRKSLEDKDPQLAVVLEKLMEPYNSGDSMRPLRGSCKNIPYRNRQF